MRLGLYGGSFDPVHYGHLLLAECCRETLALDEVWLIPAAVPPHKQTQQRVAAKHRLQMIELALAGHEQIRGSSLEIDRGGVSYTVDTLAQVHMLHPQATLFLLMGADSLRDLPTWREPDRICALSLPAVVRRGGAAEPPCRCVTLRAVTDHQPGPIVDVPFAYGSMIQAGGLPIGFFYGCGIGSSSHAACGGEVHRNTWAI